MTTQTYPEVTYGTAGNDILIGSAANDFILAKAGDDIVFGGDGDDYIFLEGDDETDFGNDYAFGGNGNDTIIAGGGDDVLNGGAGDDFIGSVSGKDTFTGGAGADTFAFDRNYAADRNVDASDVHITDFSTAEDVIALYDYSFRTAEENYQALRNSAVQSDNDVIFTDQKGLVITLHDVDLDELGLRNFTETTGTEIQVGTA